MPGDGLAIFPDFEDYLTTLVDVALGVDAARDCEANQIHLRCGREHQRAISTERFRLRDRVRLRSATPEIDLPGCGGKGAGVEVDGVAAGGLDDGHALTRRL